MSKGRFEQIEQEAQKILDKYGLKSAPIDMATVAGYLDLKVITFEFEGGVSGVLLIEREKQSIIGINPNDGRQRRRFSAAHEIGHYVLHRDNKSMFSDNYQVMFRSDNEKSVEETEANVFAAALLMPCKLVEAEFKKLAHSEDYKSDDELIKALAKKFDVSPTSMSYRLINLNLLSAHC